MDILKGVLMILLTVVMYKLAQILQRKYNNPLLNPALIGSLGIIIVLLLTRQNYTQWINHLLNATVVCLAYPLYKNKDKIVENIGVIFQASWLA